MKSLLKIRQLAEELVGQGYSDVALSIIKKAEILVVEKNKLKTDEFSGDSEEVSDDNSNKDTESKSSDSKDMVLDFIATLRVNLVLIQTAHWISKGTEFYSDHLLYERIYNALTEELDQFTEKVIALFGESVVDPVKILGLVNSKSSKLISFSENMKSEEIITMAIETEKTVLKELESLYNHIESSGELTMGLDDLLTAMFGEHENHIYLLNQRNK